MSDDIGETISNKGMSAAMWRPSSIQERSVCRLVLLNVDRLNLARAPAGGVQWEIVWVRKRR